MPRRDNHNPVIEVSEGSLQQVAKTGKRGRNVKKLNIRGQRVVFRFKPEAGGVTAFSYSNELTDGAVGALEIQRIAHGWGGGKADIVSSGRNPLGGVVQAQVILENGKVAPDGDSGIYKWRLPAKDPGHEGEVVSVSGKILWEVSGWSRADVFLFSLNAGSVQQFSMRPAMPSQRVVLEIANDCVPKIGDSKEPGETLDEDFEAYYDLLTPPVEGDAAKDGEPAKPVPSMLEVAEQIRTMQEVVRAGKEAGLAEAALRKFTGRLARLDLMHVGHPPGSVEHPPDGHPPEPGGKAQVNNGGGCDCLCGTGPKMPIEGLDSVIEKVDGLR